MADTDELVGWILSFGSQVRVVWREPLNKRIKAEATKIAREGNI